MPSRDPRMDDGGWMRPSAGRMLIDVKVVPGASRSMVAGIRDGALLVRVAAPPEKGKANEELRDCLARALGVPKSAIELVSGSSSRRKKVSVPLEAESALLALAAAASGA
jgi:uncharacterized protein